LDEIDLVVFEEMSFEVKVNGRTPDGRMHDEKRSQKLTMSLWTGELKSISIST
jgi:hypothetical protein